MPQRPIVGEWREGPQGPYRRRRSRSGRWYTEARHTNWNDNGPRTEPIWTAGFGPEDAKPPRKPSGCGLPLALVAIGFVLGTVNPIFFLLLPVAVILLFS